MRESSDRKQHLNLKYSETVVIPSTNQLFQDLLYCDSASDLLNVARTVSLATNQVLYEKGDKIQSIYFPLNSVISNLAIMDDGNTLETSMVGREGLVGISAILGSGFHQHWSWVLISGDAIRLETRTLNRLLVGNEVALKKYLSCYRSLVTQISQRGICNARHTLLQRLCCWLLMIHDRVGGDNLRLTQELMASRVGARRAGVTVAAGLLQDMRAIEYRRGQLHILQRETLEKVACECYSIMQAEFPQTHPAETRSK